MPPASVARSDSPYQECDSRPWCAGVARPTVVDDSPDEEVAMSSFQGTAPVVVGYDGSASSRCAVTWAVEEAGRQGRPLQVLHAHAFPFAAVPPRQIVPVAELAANARVV